MKIALDDAIVYSKIGVYDWERLRQTKLLISLEIDLANNVDQDIIDQTIDYDKLIEFTKQICLAGEFFLIEALCNMIGISILQNYNSKIKSCKVTVKKPFALQGVKCVSVVNLFLQG
jgi:dihydroneopterin aldolase